MSDLPFLMSAHRAAEVVGNFSNPLEVSWTYMTDNFSQFSIMTWISFVFHEVQNTPELHMCETDFSKLSQNALC